MVDVTLSVEIELGWGYHDLGRFGHFSPGRERETEFFARLLDACDELGIPFSFDVVGHLLLSECDGHHQGPYPEGWFDADPGTSVEDDPLFYAPDLVDAVEAAAVDHEVCTHSFSHVNCERMSDETITHDLRVAQRRHEATLGERSVTFVPPRHYEPPARALRDAGIECVRIARHFEEGAPKRFKSLLLGPHPTLRDETRDGVRYCRCTPYTSLTAGFLPPGGRSTHPAFRVLPLPTRVRQRLHRRYLNRAVDHAVASGASLHLWCHLVDLACSEQWVGIEGFLHDLAERREAGDVDVVRLRDRVAHETPTPKPA